MSGRYRVAVETAMDTLTTHAFWDLYEAAFGPLRTRAAARQVLTREEFDAEMVDPRVTKHVARDADGTPVGVTTLTRDLSTVPWISPEYFAARFPEHAARDAIFYLGFTLVAPGLQGSTVFGDMISSCLVEFTAARGICGYDVCAYNDEVLRMDTMIRRTMAARTTVRHHRLDAQTYYCVEVP
ncbi:hypothetical protein [Auraticoccus monumenti]|uniref:N-acetyltransferase domain-containing protein n=1 Tax=Auraticoccus monumenti TaxID=675864 RepID=A0A1G6RWG0_9ACTN|nr:hypothetical protein [Auraticoccus monumenti]SDD08734.1 hypothetical protein SAMN04489747_0134 [Auraticoccus monumenti]